MQILVAAVIAAIVYVLGKTLFEKRIPEPFIFVVSLIVFLLVALGRFKVL